LDDLTLDELKAIKNDLQHTLGIVTMNPDDEKVRYDALYKIQNEINKRK